MASSKSMIPGRSALKQRPTDPKSDCYEHSRARDAYRKQLNVFKAKFEASLREYNCLDFDAKQEIRIRAKRQREICLKNYREGLQGLAKSSFRRTYKDVFLGDREADMEMYDSNVLEFELRLTSEMDTIIDNIRLLNADKSNLSKLDWFSNLAKAKFSYEYELQNEIDPNLLCPPGDDNKQESKPEYDLTTNPEFTSISSLPYIYQPFSKRRNLYRDQDDNGPLYEYDRQQKNNFKQLRGTELNLENLEIESITDKFDYEPFQPFGDEPIGRRRNRYPNASLDPEWTSQSSFYSYHRPIQPSPRFTPNVFDVNLDSICPRYGFGEQDDDNQSTIITGGKLMAGIDYEYKPIIPSYLRSENQNQHRNNKIFEYDNQYHDSELDGGFKSQPNEPVHTQRNVHFADQQRQSNNFDDTNK